MSDTKNQQPYFPHYANARNEDNLVRLRMKHGVAGYGVYYMLLERLRLAEGYRCRLDFEVLCWDLDCSQKLIESVIYNFDLFEIVEGGEMFQSKELSEYMDFMEEKKRERAERARSAANARWDNTAPDVSDNPAGPTPHLQEKTETKAKQKLTLDQELEIMKADSEWLDAICEETGKSKEETISYFPEFRIVCIGSGQKKGHRDLIDAMKHFRSWLLKVKVEKTVEKPGLTRSQIKMIREKDEREKDSMERARNFEKMEQSKVSPEDYIRNKGYDPGFVTMVHLAQPGWTEANPPTHPEWIGKFDKKKQPEEAPAF